MKTEIKKKAYQKKYRQRPEVKEKLKEYQLNWYHQKGKKWMQEYCKEYYKDPEHKLKMRLSAKEKKMKEKRYDRENKNIIREKIIKIIGQYKIKSILTLESENFIFSNLIPNKKVIVFENDKNTFNKMEKSKPNNVSLFYGDISKFGDLNSEVDCIYLDFKGIFEFTKEEIFKLKQVIKNSKLFGVTFSLRIGNIAKERGFEMFGDYQFDLIRRLQELLEINFKVIYGEAYSDIQPMVTIFFENPEVKE